MQEGLKTTSPLSKEGETVLQDEQPKEPQYILYEVVSESQLLHAMREEIELAADEEKANLLRQDDDTGLGTGEPAHRRGGFPAWSVLIPVFLLTLMAGSLAYLCFFQTATITINPDTRHTETNGTITIVTEGTPDTANNQLRGHLLPALTMSQTQTTATTGITNQEARPGRGTITFYNASMYSQPIAAGTILTAVDGMQVATDYAVTVPAEALPAFGSVSVPAHATQTGSVGNIAAGRIGCPSCATTIQAITAAFSGGQDAASYNSVAQVDIDTEASTLKTSLMHAVTTSYQAQVLATESLVTPVSCQPTITADHQPGEKAMQVQVTESLTCTGITYDTTAFSHLIRAMQTQAAGQQTAHYHLLDDVPTTIQTAVPGGQPGTEVLSVQSRGTWVYTFTQSAQQHLVAAIAGMSGSQATGYLMRIPGIRHVSVDTVWFLPDNPQHIRFVLLVEQ